MRELGTLCRTEHWEVDDLSILLVEDELLILDIMSESLEEAGYDVFRAMDGIEAMRLMAEHPGSFSALCSDYHMPGGLTGLDVAAAMRAQYPGIPIILATGRPDVLGASWTHGERFLLLRKPYSPALMIEMIGSMVPPDHPGIRTA